MDETFVAYWVRIFGALALIRLATGLVRDAEKLITANVKARNPEVVSVLEGEPLVDITDEVVAEMDPGNEPAEWPDPLDSVPADTENTDGTSEN